MKTSLYKFQKLYLAIIIFGVILSGDCLATDIPGQNITVNTVWDVAHSPYNLTGTVSVRSGATLTIQSGVQVQGGALTINDNNSSGTLSANGVTFNNKVYLDPGATATLSGNHFNGGADVAAELANSLAGNIFPANATVNIQSGAIITAVVFPVITGVSTYSLDGVCCSGDGLFVRGGGTLTIAGGNTLSGNRLNVSDDGSGGTLMANGVTFAGNVTLYPGATATLSGNSFQSGKVDVAPQLAVSLVGNTFPGNATVNIQSRVITTAVVFPVITGVSTYSLDGVCCSGDGLFVRGGGTLTIAGGNTISGSRLNVSDDGSGGTLVANGVTFGNQLNFGSGSNGTLRYDTFTCSDWNYFDGHMAITVTDNNFAGSKVHAQGTGGPINLEGNYWGLTDLAMIAQNKIYDHTDSTSLPVIDFASPLATAPVWQPIVTYSITASAGTNGSISPNGSITKNAGDNQIFTATPVVNYIVDTWKVDGSVVQTGGVSYTLSNIQATHSVSVSFKLSTAPVTLIVSPITTTAYGSLIVGKTNILAFTVSNAGTATISGTASVGAPFSIVSGGSYTLAPGQSSTTTIRYAPAAAGNNTATATFTGGSGATLTLTGSASTDPTATTGSIAGRVVKASDNSRMNAVTISVVGPNGTQSPLAVTGVSGNQAGGYSISGLRPGAHYSVTAMPPNGGILSVVTTNEVTVVAGQTTTINIALPSMIQPLATTPQNTPVVLVRGYGPVQEWYPDDSNYWAAVRNTLHANGFSNVWDCNQPEPSIMGGGGHVINGEKGIAYNAGQLKLYIQQKAVQYMANHGGAYPPQIHIVAHSMGGLFTRGALQNNDYFAFTNPSFTVPVGKVVMLATPHCGSPVADYGLNRLSAEEFYFKNGMSIDWVALGLILRGLSSIANPTWESTSNLTTSAMQCFNAAQPWPSMPLYLFSASGGPNGGLLRLGSSVIATENELQGIDGTDEDINDGVVTKPSANGVYWTRAHWTYGDEMPPFQPCYPVTSIVLNPVQSITDSYLHKSLDHLSLLKDSAVMNWAVTSLLNPAPTRTSYSTSSAIKEHGPRKLDAGGAAQPAIPNQAFESLDGTVTNGAIVALPVTSDASTSLRFQLMAGDTNITFRLNDPSGRPINATTPQTNTNVQYTANALASNLLLATFTIANPTDGVWTAVIDAASITTTQAGYSLTVFGDSNVGLIPNTANLFSRGQNAVLTCGLADLSTNPVVAVLNASITATIRLPDGTTSRLTLVDDGWHNDGAPNDGVYAAVLTNVQQAGTYSIAYRATGANAHGQDLQRVATGTFSVSSGNGSVLGDPIYETVDADGDGYADFLLVKVWVNPTVAGNYILAGDLVDVSGTNRFSKSSAFAADGSGAMQVTLIFDLALIRAAGGSGNYHIENLQLFEQTASGTAWLDAYRGTSGVTISNVPAIASFTAAPTNGVSPLVVIFTDSSTGTITNRFWSFGDGATTNTTLTSLQHIYNAAGTNTVTLIVTGPLGVSTNRQSNYITVTSTNLSPDVTPPVLAILQPTDYQACTNASLTVTGSATDASGINRVTVNGVTATLNNTNWSQVVTLALGTNVITVIAVDNSSNANAVTQLIHAVLMPTLPPAPVAGFNAGPTNGVAPLAVTFTDASTGTITNRAWTFGDGSVSTVTSPSHTYTNAGTFSVSLLVAGPGGTNTLSRANLITVTSTNLPPAPVAGFTASPTNGIAPVVVTFTDASTGTITNRAWTFGDGGGSSAVNPSHNYTNVGVFSVSLLVVGPGGSNTVNRPGFITVTSTNITPDTTPPVLAIVSPANYQIFTNTGIAVTGTATDASGIKAVTVNGETALLAGTNWFTAVTLIQGTNTFTVIATDNSAAMNSATQVVHAVLSLPATNRATVIVAAPAVTNALLTIPNIFIVTAGDTNVFTVGAMDPDGNSLSYQWQFGDGETNSLSAVSEATHVYPGTNNCGPYTASVTVSDGAATVSSNLAVIVACDMNMSKPIGKLTATVNFDPKKPNADSASLTARLDLGAAYMPFAPLGLKLTVDISGAQLPFTLDKNGRGVSPNGTCRLAYTKPTKKLPGYWTATVTLSKGNWRNQWANYGLDNVPHKSPGKPVTLPVVVLIGGEAFAAEPTLHYTAALNKTGTAK